MINHHGSLADPTVQSALLHAQDNPTQWAVYLVPMNGAQRTAAQNRLYRQTLQKFAQQQGRSVAYWHDYFVERYLGFVEVQTEDVSRRVLCSTTDLTVSEFSSFLNAVLAQAAEMQVR